MGHLLGKHASIRHSNIDNKQNIFLIWDKNIIANVTLVDAVFSWFIWTNKKGGPMSKSVMNIQWITSRVVCLRVHEWKLISFVNFPFFFRFIFSFFFMLLASVWFLFCSILKRVLKLSWFFSWYCIYCIYMRSTLGRSVSISYVSMKIVCIHVCFKQVYLSVRWVHVMKIFNRGETQGWGWGGGGVGGLRMFRIL